MRLRTVFAVSLAAALTGAGAPSAAAAVNECEEPATPPKPPAWVAKMPKAKTTTVTKAEVQIESADGTLISARTYRPDAFKSERLPTVLIFSPYHAFPYPYRESEDAGIDEWADCMTEFLVQRGYAVVLADMRGTHNSDGCFDFGGPGDQQDGYATVQWIAKQAWSNGKVGMYGVSHVGMSQYSTAVTAPPALKAIVPIAPIVSFWRYLYMGGAQYDTNTATPAAYEYGAGGLPPLNATAANWPQNLAQQAGCGPGNVPQGMALDGTMTDYWRARDYPSMAGKIRAAVLAVQGTLDDNVKTDHFGAIWRTLQREDVPRKAVVGPWSHSEPDVPLWHLTALRWYEHWLRGNDTGMTREPEVTLIDQTGKTRTASHWLDGSPKKVTLELGAGALAAKAPAGEASYQDVPEMPRQALEQAEGARLLYAGEPLKAPLRISGQPVLDLVAAIDKDDTRFVVWLDDVAPDGTITQISRGYMGARFRESVSKPAAVAPGKAERYSVALFEREYVVPAGHRLRVLVASSDQCDSPVRFGGGVGCQSTGIVSSTTAAKVTVNEGPGLTRLVLPAAEL